MLLPKVILYNSNTMRARFVVLKDEIMAVPLPKWHKDRIDAVVVVVGLRLIGLVYVKLGFSHRHLPTSYTFI